MKTLSDARRLTAHGTLYRALARLEQMGLMTSAWEDPQIAADDSRPRRRLYAITEDGLKAAVEAQTESHQAGHSKRWAKARAPQPPRD